MSSNLIVNSYYPLEYFGKVPLEQSVPDDPFSYWASDEKLAPAAETLDYDFGAARPFNFIDFEVSGKPIDLLAFYWDGSQWVEIDCLPDTSSSEVVHYDPEAANPWVYCKCYFNTVTTQRVRLQLTRRSDPFPFPDSDPVPFSVEVRNLRLVNIMTDVSQFVADTGFDIFGNPYRTALLTYDALATTDGNSLTYWQSQPNPSKNAIECLYYDVRPSDTEDSAVVIDEVYIEPITPGIAMHIYTSNDTAQVDWDFKLWEPVPRHYVVQQGYHALPAPVACRYVKLEFTRLTATPYNVLESPQAPPIQYRLHPSWVQDEIGAIFPVETETADRFSNPFETVSIDPLLDFQRADDQLHISARRLATAPESTITDVATDTDALQEFVAESTAVDDAVDDVDATEAEIEVRPATMYQDALSELLDTNRAQSRYVLDAIDSESSDHYLTEDPLVDLDPPDTQSVADLSQAAQEKMAPLTWFPRICRHQYQIIASGRPRKIAYYAAMKTVSFTRRNYDPSVSYDFPKYLELLQDDENVEYNEFVVDPTATWRYISP
jgi:hypothetical protein